MHEMYAELVPSPGGPGTLVGNVVKVRAVFFDNPALFAELDQRSQPGYSVYGRWDGWHFTDDQGQPRSGRLELRVDIGGVEVLLRFAIEVDEPSEPLEALSHSESLLIVFEHEHDHGGKTDTAAVSLPAPPDPGGAINAMLRWRRSLPSPPSPSSSRAAAAPRQGHTGTRFRRLLRWLTAPPSRSASACRPSPVKPTNGRTCGRRRDRVARRIRGARAASTRVAMICRMVDMSQASANGSRACPVLVFYRRGEG